MGNISESQVSYSSNIPASLRSATSNLQQIWLALFYLGYKFVWLLQSQAAIDRHTQTGNPPEDDMIRNMEYGVNVFNQSVCHS